MGYGACHDQLGDRPLVSYLVPLLASVSFVPCTWGRGVGSVFFEAGQFCVGLGPGWHVPSLGCLAAPIGSSFGSGVYWSLCAGGPSRAGCPGPVVVLDSPSHPPLSLCLVAGGPCLPHPWPGWQFGLRSRRRVWTLRGRLY
jgi:hypothetical protein